MPKLKLDNQILLALINEHIDSELHDPSFNWTMLSVKMSVKATKISSLIKSAYNDSPDQYILKRRLDASKLSIKDKKLTCFPCCLSDGLCRLVKV